MDSRTANFYSHPSYQFRGSGYPIFAGSRRQRGGSILGALKSLVVPVLKSTGKSIGKSALREVTNLAKDVALDTISGKNVKQSLMRHGKRRAINLAKKSAREGANAFGSLMTSSRKRPAKMTRTNKSKRRRVTGRLF